VLFMFQPGEEGHHGARFMLDEGLLDVPPHADGTPSPVTGAFALHITSSLPSGWLTARGGPTMASADTMLIYIVGKGGHASEPHRAADPIPVACEIVQALQMMVTRTIDVFDPAVVTVGQITAGTTNNIIPETAHILGTIRTVSEATRTKVKDNIRRVVDGVAAAHGMSATLTIDTGYPVTVNDGAFASNALDVARSVAGADSVALIPPGATATIVVPAVMPVVPLNTRPMSAPVKEPLARLTVVLSAVVSSAPVKGCTAPPPMVASKGVALVAGAGCEMTAFPRLRIWVMMLPAGMLVGAVACTIACPRSSGTKDPRVEVTIRLPATVVKSAVSGLL
jgi:amidohydrolase